MKPDNEYQERYRGRAGVLAVSVHAAFFAFMYFGFNLKKEPEAAMSVELWESIPTQSEQEAVRPEPVRPAPPPPPPPPPKPAPKPEPVKPVAPPQPVEPPLPTEAEIMLKKSLEEAERRKKEQQRLEREQRQREEQQRLEHEAEQERLRLEQERLRQQQLERERLQQEQLERERQEKIEREQREQAAQEAKQRAEREAKAQAAREAREAREQVRREAAAAMAREIDKYKAGIRRKIKGNIIEPPGVADSARAEFIVRVLPGGRVVSVRLTKTSGNPLYDQAVERAIKKSSPLPVPSEPDKFNRFRNLDLGFQPKE